MVGVNFRKILLTENGVNFFSMWCFLAVYNCVNTRIKGSSTKKMVVCLMIDLDLYQIVGGEEVGEDHHSLRIVGIYIPITSEEYKTVLEFFSY